MSFSPFLAFFIDLYKLLIIPFYALAICEDINVIYKAYYAYIELKALVIFKKVYIIE
jgi:hypothetical protein